MSFGAFFLGTCLYQFASRTYQADFYDSDGAGHFVTGVMVADYVRTSLGSDPVAFAEQFYIRSPQVSFGHSPPLFHLLEGVWLLVFGTTQFSALVLIAVIAAATVCVLFRRLSRVYSIELSAMGVLLLATLKPFRWHTRIIMSDMLTVLLCALTAFAAADYAQTRRPSNLVWAIIWLVLALLTKENSLHLWLLLPGFLAVTCRRELLQQRWFVITFISVVVFTLGGFAVRIVAGPGIHGLQDISKLMQVILDFSDSSAVFRAFFNVAPWPLFALAGIGMLMWFGRKDSTNISTHLLLAVVWLVSILLFFLVAPAPAFSRYFMPALIPLVMLCVYALAAIQRWFAIHMPRAAMGGPWVICLATIFISATPVPGNTWGFEPVAAAIPVRPNLVTMIASDAYGDGAFIVERLMADRDQQGIVLRADKALASSDWMGTYYSLKTMDIDSLAALLDSVPVHYLVLDRFSRSGDRMERHRELLAQLVDAQPEKFREIGRFPLVRRGLTFPDAIVVYQNSSARTYEVPNVEVDLGNSLGRKLKPSGSD